MAAEDKSSIEIPSSQSARQTPKYYSYKDVYFSESYRNLNFNRKQQPAPQDASKLSMLVTPNKIQAFFTEGCLVKSLVMGAGGGVLGILFGSFFFTMKPMDVDTTLPFMKQVRQQYKGFVPDVLRTSKNFAKIGFVYSLVECFLERERATRDINSAVYAGCITGGALAWKGGALGIAGGCAMFAVFSGLMEKFQPFSSGD